MAASGVEKIRSWQEVKIVKLNLIEPLCSGDIGLVFMLTDSVGPQLGPSKLLRSKTVSGGINSDNYYHYISIIRHGGITWYNHHLFCPHINDDQ